MSIKRAAVGETRPLTYKISIQAFNSNIELFFLLRKSAQNPFTTYVHTVNIPKGRGIHS